MSKHVLTKRRGKDYYMSVKFKKSKTSNKEREKHCKSLASGRINRIWKPLGADQPTSRRLNNTDKV